MSQVEDYYWIMAARHRLVTILAGGSVAALCTFFLLDSEQEVADYYHRPMWSTPPDLLTGLVVYVDKLISYIPITISLANRIAEEITKQVPYWQTAVWYRPRHGDFPDRKYTLKRRWPNGQV